MSIPIDTLKVLEADEALKIGFLILIFLMFLFAFIYVYIEKDN